MRKEEPAPMRRTFTNDNKGAGPIKREEPKREEPKAEEKPKMGGRFFRN